MRDSIEDLVAGLSVNDLEQQVVSEVDKALQKAAQQPFNPNATGDTDGKQ